MNKAYDQAIADYTQAITLKIDAAEAYLGRAMIYQAQGAQEHAVADLQAVLARSDKPSVRRRAEELLRALIRQPEGQ